MKKALYLFRILFGVVFLSSCRDIPGVYSVPYEFVNNSTDTIGFSFYEHYSKDQGKSIVWYFTSRNSIPPQTSIKSSIVHNGGDSSLGSLFEQENVDTMYVYITKTVLGAEGQMLNLPDEATALKVYKFHKGNCNLKSMNYLIIEYP